MAGATRIRHGKGKITLRGFNELYRALNVVDENAQEAGREVLNAAVERVFQKSQALVPVAPEDGGQLKASARKSKARISRRSGSVTASVQYGGSRLLKIAPNDNPIYAIVQHEDLTLKHSRGEAKYLEKPALAERERVERELADRIMRKIANG